MQHGPLRLPAPRPLLSSTRYGAVVPSDGSSSTSTESYSQPSLSVISVSSEEEEVVVVSERSLVAKGHGPPVFYPSPLWEPAKRRNSRSIGQDSSQILGNWDDREDEIKGRCCISSPGLLQSFPTTHLDLKNNYPWQCMNEMLQQEADVDLTATLDDWRRQICDEYTDDHATFDFMTHFRRGSLATISSAAAVVPTASGTLNGLENSHFACFETTGTISHPCDLADQRQTSSFLPGPFRPMGSQNYTVDGEDGPNLQHHDAVPAADWSRTAQRALLIGMNYSTTQWATEHALSHSQDDIRLMKDYLIESAGWLEQEITLLTDAEGTPQDLLPTKANIMREIELLRDSNCKNTFFVYTGHSDQRQELEGYSQYLIPIDAVVGPKLEDVDGEHIVLDDDLHDCLISSLPARSTFLAILDSSHSATLLDLKPHNCNRRGTFTSLLRRSLRRFLVEPAWKVLRRPDSFRVSDTCNGLCVRRNSSICPIAVSISACKDRQQVYEGRTSLTQTVVEVLKSNPAASLRDIVDTVGHNDKLQQEQMKRLQKRLRKEGNDAMRQKLYEKRREARILRPQIASTGALDLTAVVGIGRVLR